MKQIVQSPTRNDAILDLIFTNIKDLYDTPITSAPLVTSDHACIKWRTIDKDQGIKPIKRKVKVRPVRPSRLIEFRHWLSNYDWFSVYSIATLDEKVGHFARLLGEAIDWFFPTR